MAGSDLIRKKIRDNAQNLIIDAATLAGSSVYKSRPNKAFLEELPAVFLYTPEDVPQIDGAPKDQNFNKICTLRAEIIVNELGEFDTIEDIADVLAGEVEDVLLMNIHLQHPDPTAATPGDKILNKIMLGGTTCGPTNDILENSYGVVTEFQCEYYYCTATFPVTDDFNRFAHDYDQKGQVSENLTEIPVTP